jgi:hypothetical protein
LAPWGSGKTLFMVAESIKLADSGEKVLFLFFARGDSISTTKKSLLAMDLELKFQEYGDLIQIETVLFKDGEDNKLRELGQGFKHVMCDELFADIDNLTKKSQNELKDFFSSKETVWMALSNRYYLSKIDDSVDLEAHVKGMFPGFQVARMQIPLRMPKTVAEDIRTGYANNDGKATQLDLNEKLCAESQLPPNLTEGCKIEGIGHREFKPFYEILREAFDKLPKGKSAVIVIDDRQLEATNQIIRSIIKCQHCRDLNNVLVVDVALAKLGKKAVYHCLN